MRWKKLRINTSRLTEGPGIQHGLTLASTKINIICSNEMLLLAMVAAIMKIGFSQPILNIDWHNFWGKYLTLHYTERNLLCCSGQLICYFKPTGGSKKNPTLVCCDFNGLKRRTRKTAVSCQSFREARISLPQSSVVCPGPPPTSTLIRQRLGTLTPSWVGHRSTKKFGMRTWWKEPAYKTGCTRWTSSEFSYI